MNVFILDEDPILCAQYHNDKHVVKMILEYTQLISNYTYKYINSYSVKPGWLNHPATKWICSSASNFRYICTLRQALCKEYTHRYGKVHQYEHKHLYTESLIHYGNTYDLTYIACMPDECKVPNDSITSYRNYYKLHKRHIAKWTKRDAPPWFS